MKRLMIIAALVAVPVMAGSIDDVLENFRKHLQSSTKYTTQQKAEVRAKLDTTEGKQKRHVVMEALRILEPKMKKALQLANEQKFEESAAVLKELTKAKDPFVAGNAKVALVDVNSRLRRYEDCVESLDELNEKYKKYVQVSDEFTLHKASILLNLTDFEKASEIAFDFIVNNADGDPELLARANKLYETAGKLAERTPSINLVSRLIIEAHRRLYFEKLDENTVERQQEVVEALDKLIEEASKSSSSSSSSASSSSSGSAQSTPASKGAQGFYNSGAQKQSAPNKSADRDSAKFAWGAMPPKEREQVKVDVQKRFPKRYQMLIEQYYKDLQETDDE